MRNLLRPSRVLVLVAAVVALPACKSLWGEDEVGLQGAQAIVVYARSRTEDAHRTTVILQREGMQVEKQVQGPVGPEESRIRVHGTSRYPERAARLREVLANKVELKWMEFTGADERAVYVWLVD